MVKIRQDKQVINKAIYLALGINVEGHKELLGMWFSENEGAKFWLGILTELENRSLEDILIACDGGLKGFPKAIQTVYPQQHGAIIKRSPPILSVFTNQPRKMRSYASLTTSMKNGLLNTPKLPVHGAKTGEMRIRCLPTYKRYARHFTPSMPLNR